MDANECGTPRCARCEVQDGTQFILRENGMRLMGSTAFFPQNSSIQDILFLQFFFVFARHGIGICSELEAPFKCQWGKQDGSCSHGDLISVHKQYC
jgi:hypothetical protein